MAADFSLHGSIQAVAMRSNSQSGYALALLLWMITGMSLMVTAVIHFARDDIGLSELRVNEAKSRALARGLGYLVSRDMALREFEFAGRGVETEEGGSLDGRANEGNAIAENQSVGPFEYRFERVLGTVFVRSASAFVSLNNASEEELFKTLVVLGQAESGAAISMMHGIIDYRNQVSPVSREMTDFRGYRFKEELLTTAGVTRSVYDRVKDFVHVHRTNGLDPGSAPPELASIFAGERGGVGSTRAVNNAGNLELSTKASVPQGAGPVTFEAIYERRLAARSSGVDVKAITVELAFDNGFRSRYLVWMTGSGNTVLRAERLSLAKQEAT